MMRVLSESANPRPLLAARMMHPVARGSLQFWCLKLCAVSMLASFPASLFAQSSCPGIQVNILDIRNSAGSVACALFEAPEGFPERFLEFATNITMIKIQDTQARCNFFDIPPGTYALAVIHDENKNGELDTNWLGVPVEGYGFSNDVTASLSAPSFDAARFAYDGLNLDMTITLNYH